MNLLWTPEQTPPQLTSSAADALRTQLATDDAAEVIRQARTDLDQEELLAAFLDELGFELNQASAEGPWPARALHAGAAITLMAYRQAGVTEAITSAAIETGHFIAELHGLPDAYVLSTFGDPRLVDVTRTVFSSPIFDESQASERAKGGYDQVGMIGAGCTRLYLQQAVELAA